MWRRGSPKDREAFRELFEAHREPVYRLLCRLVRDPHDAEDLLQETFVRLWRKRAQFRGDGSLAGYLRSIAYRTFLNARPRLGRGRAMGALPEEPVDGRRGPAREVERNDMERYLLARVRAVVDELPDSWREPFVLFRYEGLTCREVAEMTGLTPKAVEMRVSKALQRVAARLRDLRAEFTAR